MIAALTARAIDYFETPDGAPTPSLVDYAVAWIESGETLVSLARKLTEGGTTCSRGMLAEYLNNAEGDAGKQKLVAARKVGAHAHAEKALDDVEQAQTEDESRRAERTGRNRHWLAEKWNKEDFGKQPDVQIAISAGSMHLEALQAAPPREALPAPPPQPALPAVDAEDVVIEKA